MHLTRMTDFSLRVLMHVAGNDLQLSRSSELAAALDIPAHQMMKVVQRLAHAGYLQTRRGKGGGIRLALAAQEIRIGDVIRRLEPSLEIVDCRQPLCPLAGRCRLKHALDKATDQFLEQMNAVSLADIARPATGAVTRPAGRQARRDRAR